ncbi:hypothetical protein [Prescottella equi]|uniref:hypothetical protein n=1 Tax=Rhodococcus hoagii TaxID=43767 RepID=UPI001EEB6818|nr:hypothetical protein [Prescottella equi]
MATHANDPREPTRAGSHGSFPPSAGQHVSIRPDCGIALRWKSSPYTGGVAVLPPKVLPLMLLPLFADPNVTSELKAFPLNRLKIIEDAAHSSLLNWNSVNDDDVTVTAEQTCRCALQ